MKILPLFAIILPVAVSCSSQKLSSIQNQKSKNLKDSDALVQNENERAEQDKKQQSVYPANSGNSDEVAGIDPAEEVKAAPGAYIPGDGNSDRFKVGNGLGLLGCPVVPEDFNSDSVVKINLPATFTSLGCSDCHGSSGEGKGQYPSLQSYPDPAQFLAVVRSGAPGMTPYGQDQVSDAGVKEIYDALVALDPGTPILSQDSVGNLSAEALEKKYQSGLAAWRKPGSLTEAACVNCHTFDGIDLAVIGYSDADIMRRAQQHTDVGHAKQIIEYVHVMREKYKVGTPCSPNWRPFQPGGEVLPGSNMVEQDTSFAKNIKEEGYFFINKPVTNLATAKTMMNELNAMDIKKIKIGTPFPKWSQDPFHGPEEAGTHDWIPHAPVIYVDQETAFKVADEYLENPTDENLNKAFDWYRNPETEPSRLDFKNVNMEDPFHSKKMAQMLAQHYFRNALAGKPSWFDVGMDYMDRFTKLRVDPWWGLGNSTLRPCTSINDSNVCPRETLHKVWPKEYLNDFTEMGNNAQWPSSEEFRNSTHSWWTMSIFNSQSGYNMTYWQHRVGGHQFHRDFLNLMKELPVKLGINNNRTDGFPGYPAYAGKGAVRGIHPLLDGANKGDLGGSQGGVGGVEAGSPVVPEMMTITHNTYAMFGRIALEQIQKDPRVGNKDKLVSQYENWQSRIGAAIAGYESYVASSKEPAAFIISKAQLQETHAMLGQLVSAAKAAKEVSSN